MYDLTSSTHWLDWTPRAWLHQYNTSYTFPPQNHTSISIRIHIRNTNSVFVLQSATSPSYRLPEFTMRRSGKSTLTIRDAIMTKLQADGNLSPESLIHLQFMEHSRHLPVYVRSVPDQNDEEQLRLYVLLIADRRDPEPASWAVLPKVDNNLKIEWQKRTHFQKEFLVDTMTPYEACTKHALLTRDKQIPPPPFKTLAEHIICDMIKMERTCDYFKNHPFGFIIEKENSNGSSRSVLLLPRTREQYMARKWKVPLPIPATVYTRIGSWTSPSMVTLEEAEAVWKSMFRDDGTLNVKWVNPDTGVPV